MKEEGEWKDGKPDGRGVWFDEEGNKKYEGEWENGLFHVKDKIWFNYMTGKEQKVLDFEQKKVKKDKRLSTEEVGDQKANKKTILNRKTIIILSMILILIILIIIICSVYVSVKTLKLDVDKNTKDIILRECDSSKRYLTISGYPNLERIIFSIYSCPYIKKVVIKDNPNLSTFMTGWQSFYNTTSLTLKSIF